MGSVAPRHIGELREGFSRRVIDPLINWRNSLRAGPKTIYLHIGAHKTGTTAVQAMLKAEARRLRWHGFFHDRRFYRLGIVLSRRSPLPRSEREQLRRDLDAALRDRPECNIIGSSEGFFGDLFASYTNIRAVAEDLHAVLEGYNVRIIACIRRQDHFIESVYQQHVKRGGTLRFDAFIQTHDIHAYRWDELLGQYAAVFGRSAMSVLCYEDLFRSPNGILEKLFEPLGASGFRGVSRSSLRNPPLSAKGIEIAIRCNDLLDVDEQWALRRFLQSTFKRESRDEHGLFTEDERRELLRFYGASNERCMGVFLPDTSSRVSYLADTH